MNAFRVAITNDFAPGNRIAGWIDEPIAEILAGLPDLEIEYLPASPSEPTGQLVRGYDAVISGERRWTAENLRGVDRLALIASWSIGVDNIDLRAATENDVAVTNSPSPANHASVAESALAFMLALSKRVFAKDRLTKEGRADDAQRLLGTLIRHRVVGTIGLGATARLLIEMVRPLRPARMVSFDPYVTSETASQIGVELVDLETLMTYSDYVVVMCSLTDETRGLIGTEGLEMMKPEAYLINTARGPIVDQHALTHALAEGWIAGAGLDVTEIEPPERGDPLLELDNVIVTGHALAWTEESLRGACLEPCRAVASLYEGHLPEHVVNRQVLTRPGFRAKLERSSHSR